MYGQPQYPTSKRLALPKATRYRTQSGETSLFGNRFEPGIPVDLGPIGAPVAQPKPRISYPTITEPKGDTLNAPVYGLKPGQGQGALAKWQPGGMGQNERAGMAPSATLPKPKIQFATPENNANVRRVYDQQVSANTKMAALPAQPAPSSSFNGQWAMSSLDEQQGEARRQNLLRELERRQKNNPFRQDDPDFQKRLTDAALDTGRKYESQAHSGRAALAQRGMMGSGEEAAMMGALTGGAAAETVRLQNEMKAQREQQALAYEQQATRDLVGQFNQGEASARADMEARRIQQDNTLNQQEKAIRLKQLQNQQFVEDYKMGMIKRELTPGSGLDAQMWRNLWFEGEKPYQEYQARETGIARQELARNQDQIALDVAERLKDPQVQAQLAGLSAQEKQAISEGKWFELPEWVRVMLGIGKGVAVGAATLAGAYLGGPVGAAAGYAGSRAALGG